MKATKLIRDKGLQYAREIIDSAPRYATEWNEGYEFQCGQSVEISQTDRDKYFVDLIELKDAVYACDLVKYLGGYERAKARLNVAIRNNCTLKEEHHIRWMKAIKFYESIYQPKCSHGYDVACLICGFGTVEGERIYRNKGKTA